MQMDGNQSVAQQQKPDNRQPSGRLRSAGHAVANVLKEITVEPFTLLYFASYSIFNYVFVYMLYERQCSSNYDVERVCRRLSEPENKQAEMDVQFRSSTYMTYMEAAKFLPIFFSTMLMGSFGEQYATKPPLMIAVASSTLLIAAQLTAVSVPETPMYSFVIIAAVFGLSGQQTAVLTCVFTHLAKRIDERCLTLRYAIVTACWSMAHAGAGGLSTVLLDLISLQWTGFVAVGLMTFTFFAVWLFYPSNDFDKRKRPPPPPMVVVDGPKLAKQPSLTDGHSTLKTSENNCPEKKSPAAAAAADIPTSVGCFGKLSLLFLSGWKLYQSAWRTVVKRRPGRGRLHLIVLCVFGLIHASADGCLDVVYVFYTYKSPLAWSPSELATFSATLNASHTVMSVLSAYIFQRLKVPNLIIMQVSLISIICQLTLTSLAVNSLMMYLGLALGSLATVGYSAFQSFILEFADEDEAGGLIACEMSIFAFVPLFSIVYNSIYMATVDWFSGLVFALCAGLVALCAIVFIVVHIDSRNRRYGAIRKLKRDKVTPIDC